MSESLLAQFVPGPVCLACDVCCRFLEPTSPMAPFFSEAELERCGLPQECFCLGGSGRGEPVLLSPRPVGHAGYECPAFAADANRCRIYERRPLDCQIYPFVLSYDPSGARVVLALDQTCPYAKRHRDEPSFIAAARQLARRLDSEWLVQIAQSPGLVGEAVPGQHEMAELPQVSRALCRTDLGLARLTAASQERCRAYLECHPRRLSAHAFAAIYMWKDFFNLFWKVVEDRLLIVAEDRGAAFLIVPPFGTGPERPALEEARQILLAINADSPATRVEYVGDEELPALLQSGWQVRSSTEEFVGDTGAWATLSGNEFRSQRAACNYFEKHGGGHWRAFRPEDLPPAIALYRRWSEHRRAKHPDSYFAALIQNSFLAHVRALRQAASLGIQAWVVEVQGELAAYTFGCGLPGGETFAVLGEVADPERKGLAAFTFRQLCREVHSYRLVNIMGDSGLASLRAAKLQYHPAHAARVHTLTPRSGKGGM